MFNVACISAEVSFISISKEGIGELVREINIHLTDPYNYTDFEHPDSSEENADFIGNYSSYTMDLENDEKYDYLIKLGKNLTSDNQELHSDVYLLNGCQSQVWMKTDNKNTLSRRMAIGLILLTF